MKFDQLCALVRHALMSKKYRNCEIDVLGSKDISEGFLSDIVFLQVNCENESGKTETLHLAIKKAVEIEQYRKELNFENIFKQECVFYEEIFPTLIEFQKQKGVKPLFNPFPRCYYSTLKSGKEMIILENLKVEGFELCDKHQPLSRKHIELGLESFAKFHAVSLSLKDQNPSKFEDITKKLENTFKLHFSGLAYEYLDILHRHNLDILLEKKETELHCKLENLLSRKHIVQQFLDFSEEATGCAVLSHCDSWINNLMFKHQVWNT